jgi:hypothetical protein
LEKKTEQVQNAKLQALLEHKNSAIESLKAELFALQDKSTGKEFWGSGLSFSNFQFVEAQNQLEQVRSQNSMAQEMIRFSVLLRIKTG